MKTIIIIILSLFDLSIYAQENPFNDLKYDKVVAYEFQGDGFRTIDIVLNGEQKLLDNKTTLDSFQINRFEDIICKKDAYGQNTASCFDPHFAVIYFLDDSVVAQIDVCLSCNYLISSVEIPAVNLIKVGEGTEYERPLYGFSKSTRKDLDEFITSLNFIKYRESFESIFDD